MPVPPSQPATLPTSPQADPAKPQQTDSAKPKQTDSAKPAQTPATPQSDPAKPGEPGVSPSPVPSLQTNFDPRPAIFTREFFKFFLGKVAVPIGEKLPESALLQKQYEEVWLQVSEKFYDPNALTDWGKWRHAYDGKLFTTSDLDAALKAMVSSLGDRWTKWTSEDDFKAASAKAANGIVGAGLQLKVADGGGYAIELIRYGSSAYKSELHAGDRVKSVAGKAIDGMKLSEIEPLLEGKIGSTVAIVYLRDGKDRTVNLTFNPTTPGKAEAALLPGGVLYLRLAEFSDADFDALVKATTELARSDDFAFDYIVFDLRNNPGGLVRDAEKVVELFLESGKIMSYVERSNRTTQEITKNVRSPFEHELKTLAEGTVDDTDLLYHKPMAVLVNGSTASSAEITSAALADNHRAILVGQRTFGKALAFITTTFDKSELQLTVEKIKSPNGNDWGSGKGLTPDFVIEQSRDTSVDVQLMKAIELLKRNAGK